MTAYARKLALSALTAYFAVVLGATPALAKVHHKNRAHSHHHARRHSHQVHEARSGSIISIAQNHLSHLGYYSGRIDGVMGANTKLAIRRFQGDHDLKVDGVLGPRTRRALDVADQHAIGRHSFMTHDVVTRSDTAVPLDPDYVNSMNGQTKMLSSRFGAIEVSETGMGTDKRYSVDLNGQPVLTVDGQPSVISISPTYDMGSEDAVVFTTYNPSEGNCMYKSHVLAMSSVGTKMIDIDNCTRALQARVDNGSLYISFPEHDDNRALSATYRLEGMSLERL